MSWQPIETAPKDGVEILAADFRGRMHVVSWSEACREWKCAAWSHHDVDFWQPLPKEPK